MTASSTIRAMLLSLFLVHGQTNATPVWSIAQEANNPLGGSVNTALRGDALAIFNGSNIYAVTPDRAFPITIPNNELLVSRESWVQIRAIPSGEMYLVNENAAMFPLIPCPHLLPGARAFVGRLQCQGTLVRLMKDAAIEALLKVPDRYQLIDVLNEGNVLLASENDGSLAIGGVDLTNRTFAVGSPLPFSREQISFRLSRSEPLAYFGSEGYVAFVSNRLIYRFAPGADPAPDEQCSFGVIPPSHFFSVERENGERRLRGYSLTSPHNRVADVALQTGDYLFCGPANVLPRPYIIRPNPQAGDSILGVSTSSGALQHIATVTNTTDGPGTIHVVGNTSFVRYESGRMTYVDAFNPSQQTPLPPSLSNMSISVGPNALDPVNEFTLRPAVGGDLAQLQILERSPADGSVVSANLVPFGPSMVRNRLSLSSVDRHPTWPAGKRLVSSFRNGIAESYLLDNLQLTPLLDDAGQAVGGPFRHLSANRIFIAQSSGTNVAEFSLGGQFLRNLTVAAPFSAVAQQDALLTNESVDGQRIVRRIANGLVLWERSFAEPCEVLGLGDFPLVSCPQGLFPRLSLLQRLSAVDGSLVWQRLVTPIDLAQPFEARSAWLDGDKLHVAAWTNQGAVSLAQLNPQTGSIVSVSRPLLLDSRLLVLSSVGQFPFGHRWMYFFGTVSGGSFRSAIKIEADGELTGFNLAASRLWLDSYVSEASQTLATNEGVRWYMNRRLLNQQLLGAYAFPSANLSQPLTLSYSLDRDFRSEFSATAKLSIGNGSPVAAQGARIHTQGLDCPETGSRATLEFNVPANSTRRVECTIALNPMGEPVSLKVLLRQPINGVVTTRMTELTVQAQSLLRNGFE